MSGRDIHSADIDSDELATQLCVLGNAVFDGLTVTRLESQTWAEGDECVERELSIRFVVTDETVDVGELPYTSDETIEGSATDDAEDTPEYREFTDVYGQTVKLDESSLVIGDSSENSHGYTALADSYTNDGSDDVPEPWPVVDHDDHRNDKECGWHFSLADVDFDIEPYLGPISEDEVSGSE